jgi:hypothetical protein
LCVLASATTNRHKLPNLSGDPLVWLKGNARAN